MAFELWDRDTGNRVGTFARPEDAFSVVLEIAKDDEGQDAVSLVLGVEDDAGRPHRIAAGRSLLAIARESRHDLP